MSSDTTVNNAPTLTVEFPMSVWRKTVIAIEHAPTRLMLELDVLYAKPLYEASEKVKAIVGNAFNEETTISVTLPIEQWLEIAVIMVKYPPSAFHFAMEPIFGQLNEKQRQTGVYLN